ncbi:hypothetical protein T484DRAFT_1845021 [Baffinella frigidus]|nr:hypothetical protein T484DRAFT_1845021 [Cryptophyta sp. CCMP2293]
MGSGAPVRPASWEVEHQCDPTPALAVTGSIMKPMAPALAVTGSIMKPVASRFPPCRVPEIL